MIQWSNRQSKTVYTISSKYFFINIMDAKWKGENLCPKAKLIQNYLNRLEVISESRRTAKESSRSLRAQVALIWRGLCALSGNYKGEWAIQSSQGKATQNPARPSVEAVPVTHCDEGSSLIQSGLPPGASNSEAKKSTHEKSLCLMQTKS